MANKIVLYAINALSPEWDDKPFDLSILPFSVLPDVTVEDLSALVTEEAFAWAKTSLSPDDFKTIVSTRYGLVYRYQTRLENRDDEDDKAEVHITNIAACLRLIRPMRQKAMVIQGQITSEGKFQVQHFDHPVHLMEVPTVQKLFHLQPEDLDLLRLVIEPYLKAMTGDYWKIKLAMQYHDGGHWLDRFWKPRFSLWVSGIEALYATHDADHNGRLVISERVKYLLGSDTSVYDEGDIPRYFTQARFSVGEIIDDVYKVRNLVVHGERIPVAYNARGRTGFDGDINRMEVLTEGLSFILRKSILRVLRDNLLEDFKDRASSRKYWTALSLTRSDLIGERNVLRTLKAQNGSLKVEDVALILNDEKQAQIKLHSDSDIAKYLNAGVSKGTIRKNGNGTYESI